MDYKIYDIEVFPNFFCLCAEDYLTNSRLYFEISEWRDDSKALLEFAKGWLIGYNSMDYDNIMLNFIIQEKPNNLQIYLFNKICLEDNNYMKIKKWKYNNNYITVDIMRLMFSKGQRVSLKELQVTMNWPNVLECELDFDKPIVKDNIPTIKYYCFNDVSSTKNLMIINRDRINLRISIQKEYGLKCLSKDDVRLGVDLFANFYEKDSGSQDFLEKRSPRPIIFLKDCISDKIHFKSEIFCNFLVLLKNKMISNTKGALDYKIPYGGTMFVFGTGGAHSADKPGIYKPKSDEFYLDIDVTGMYPSIWINSNKAPEHLDADIFMPRYKWMRDTRAANKKTNKMLADTLKLATNGSFGNLINEYSWLYDPSVAMSITLCGQLFLSMLAERLIDFGVRIESANTDGLSLFVKKDKYNEFKNICKQWEDETGLFLEESRYYKTLRRDVNCYFSWYANEDGSPKYNDKKEPYIKEKGAFLTTAVLGKGYDKPIIAKAIKQYFIDETPIEDFIRNHDNIFDFCIMQKVDRKFKTIWGNTEVQKTNRFYITSNPNAGYLKKVDKYNGKEFSIYKGFGVQIFNKYEKKEMKDYRINYNYYISETRKLICTIDSKQLNLFGDE